MQHKPHTWILDAGHGNNTHGKRSPIWNDGTQLFEYEYNRAIVALIVDGLIKNNVDFRVLVTELWDVPLSVRVRRVNSMKTKYSKILVSVHGNAAGTPKASGFETFTTPGVTGSDAIATPFIEELENEFPEHKHRKDYTDGDADKEANFYIIRKTYCRAILTENEFFTNYEMCKLMLTSEFRQRVANAHIKAILRIENLI